MNHVYNQSTLIGNDYDNEFLKISSNQEACDFLFENDFDQVVLQGPAKSGKKHLIYMLLKKKPEIDVFFLDNFSDTEIISKYDFFKNTNKKVVWIWNDEIKFSSDVLSRMKSLYHIKIKDLNLMDFSKFLYHRMNIVNFFPSPYVISFLLKNIKVDYQSIDHFINFIKKENKLTFSSLKKYFRAV